jgi:hypothetical protein
MPASFEGIDVQKIYFTDLLCGYFDNLKVNNSSINFVLSGGPRACAGRSRRTLSCKSSCDYTKEGSAHLYRRHWRRQGLHLKTILLMSIKTKFFCCYYTHSARESLRSYGIISDNKG